LKKVGSLTLDERIGIVMGKIICLGTMMQKKNWEKILSSVH